MSAGGSLADAEDFSSIRGAVLYHRIDEVLVSNPEEVACGNGKRGVHEVVRGKCESGSGEV